MRTVRTSHVIIIGMFDVRNEWLLRAILVIALLAGALLSAPANAHAVVRADDTVDGLAYAQRDVPEAAMPDVELKAGALVTEDGRVLWSRRIDDRRAIASITKIMTAIIALENSELDAPVTVPRDSVRVGESTSFLRVGEKLPMSEMLEALLVKSGNDAGFAIAAHIAGDESAFAQLMNAKAEELGLSGTRFSNSHGLDAPGHHSNARDLAVLARYAMTIPLFRDIVSQKSALIGTGSRSERVDSTNLLIGNYAGANGVKTGWTDDAGYCVIESAQRDGVELYAVVLGSTGELQRFRDARALLDFGFAHYRPQQLASAGTVIGEARVTDYLDVLAPAAVSLDTTVTVFDLAGPITREVAVSAVEAPIAAGQRIGVATFTQDDVVVASVPLVATKAVPAPTVLQRMAIALARVWRALSRTTGEPVRA